MGCRRKEGNGNVGRKKWKGSQELCYGGKKGVKNGKEKCWRTTTLQNVKE